ncbi:hypothetical protein K6L09_21085 [Burkholderia cepacia]
MRKGKPRKREKRQQLVNDLKSIDTSKMCVKEIWNLPLEGMDMFHNYKTFWFFLQRFDIPHKKKHDTIIKLQQLDTSSMTFKEIHSQVGTSKTALQKITLKYNIQYRKRVREKGSPPS